MWACKEFYETNMIKLFLEAGGDVSSRNKDGETPFMNIVRHPQALMRLSILDFMIDNGANPNISNKYGKSVWDYAAEQDGMTDYLCVRLLEESCHD